MAKPKIIIPDAIALEERQRVHDLTVERQYGRSLHYDRERHALFVTLRSGIGVLLPVEKIRELASAKPEQLDDVRLIASGGAIEQRSLDVDLSLPGLLRDVMGFELQQLRAARVTSPKKAVAARANGQHGGRPRAAQLRKDSPNSTSPAFTSATVKIKGVGARKKAGKKQRKTVTDVATN